VPLTALCARRREQEQGPALPYAADLPVIRPERLNRLSIPVIHINHTSIKGIAAGLVSIPVSTCAKMGLDLVSC
jgi:hypothetical protein